MSNPANWLERLKELWADQTVQVLVAIAVAVATIGALLIGAAQLYYAHRQDRKDRNQASRRVSRVIPWWLPSFLRRRTLTGRAALLRVADQHVAARRSVILVGPSGVGKSAILAEVYSHALKWGGVQPGDCLKFEANYGSTPLSLLREVVLSLIARHRNVPTVTSFHNYDRESLLAELRGVALSRPVWIFVDGLTTVDQASIMRDLAASAPMVHVFCALQSTEPVHLEPLVNLTVEPLEYDDARRLFQKLVAKSAKGQELSQATYKVLAGNTLAIKLFAESIRQGFPPPDIHAPPGSLPTTNTDEPYLYFIYSKLSTSAWVPLAELIDLIGTLRVSQIPEWMLVDWGTDTATLRRLLEPYGVVRIGAAQTMHFHASFVRWSGRQAAARAKQQQTLSHLAQTITRYASEGEWRQRFKGLSHMLARYLSTDSVDDRLIRAVSLIVEDNYDDPRGVARDLGEIAAFAEVSAHLRTVLAQSPAPAAGTAIKNIGILNYWVGRDDEAESCFNLCRELFRRNADENGEIIADYLLGFLADDRSLYTDAYDLYKRGHDRALAMSPQDPYLVGSGAHLIGCAIYHQGGYLNAEPWFLEAVRLADAHAFPDLEARARRRLAAALMRQGDTASLQLAQKRLDDAEHVAGALQRHRDVLRIKRHKAELQLRFVRAKRGADMTAERLREARSLALQAVAGFRSLGFRRGVGYSLRALAEIAVEEGDLDGAAGYLTESIQIARQAKSLYGEAAAYRVFALVELQRGHAERAAVLRRDAKNLLSVIGHSDFMHANAEFETSKMHLNDKPKEVRGVIFDLMETLAETDDPAYRAAMTKIAAALHVDPARLRSVWAQSRQQASTGGFSTTQERIAWVAAQLDCRVSNSVLDDLAKATDDVWRLNVTLYSDTRTVLTELRARGLKLGILSNGPRAMVVLKESLAINDLLDFFLVSCETGALKPDAQSYRIAIETMGLLPEQIVYVGDGNDHELNGAKDAGLYTVRVRRSAAAYADPKNQSTFWNADITQLEELLNLIPPRAHAPSTERVAAGQ